MKHRGRIVSFYPIGGRMFGAVDRQEKGDVSTVTLTVTVTVSVTVAVTNDTDILSVPVA
jgi:hypothetical protein